MRFSVRQNNWPPFVRSKFLARSKFFGIQSGSPSGTTGWGCLKCTLPATIRVSALITGPTTWRKTAKPAGMKNSAASVPIGRCRTIPSRGRKNGSTQLTRRTDWAGSSPNLIVQRVGQCNRKCAARDECTSPRRGEHDAHRCGVIPRVARRGGMNE